MANAGGIRLGRAFVEIDAIDTASRVLRRIGMNVRALGRQIASFGQRALWQGLFANLGTMLAANEFRRFDDVMRRVQAKSTGTADSMAHLRDMTKSLSVETGIATDQIGTLMEQLAQGGFNYDQIAEMTLPILKLSKGGGKGDTEDTKLAAEAVTQAIRSFGLESKDAVEVSDILVTSLNDSNFALEDLISTMAYLGPTAKVFKNSIREVLALGAVLRNLNIRAETAGTAIRNMNLQMSNAPGREKFNVMLKEMNGQVVKFSNDGKNLRPLPELLHEIGKATQGLGTMQKGELFGELLGLRALVPTLFLTEDAVLGVGSAFGKMFEALQDVDGAATKTMSIIRGGIGGALDSLLAQLKLVLLAWGEKLAPALMGVGRTLGPLLDSLKKWIELNPKIILGLTVALALIPALGLACIALGYAIIVAANGLLLLSAALGALAAVAGVVFGILTTPVTLAFLAALLAWMPIIITYWKELKALVVGVFSNLFEGSGFDGSSFTEVFTNIFSIVSEGFKRLSEDGAFLIDEIVEAISAGEIEIAMKLVVLALEHQWLTLKHTIQGVMNEIYDGIRKMYEEMRAWYEWAMTPVKAISYAMSAPWPGMSDFTGNPDRKSNNAEAEAINARRAAEFKELTSLPQRTPEQMERIRQLHAGGFVPTDDKTDFQKAMATPITQEMAKAGNNRDDAMTARQDEIRAEIAKLSAEVEASKAKAEAARLAEFEARQRAAQPGALPAGGMESLPQGVGAMAMPYDVIQGAQYGSADAMKAFYENSRPLEKEKEVTELLEDTNAELATTTSLLRDIRDELREELA